MNPRVSKVILKNRKDIKCEAEPGKGGGHAGLILLTNDEGKREVLGRTDPTFKTAKAAVSAMKKTVSTVVATIPAPAVEEKPEERSK